MTDKTLKTVVNQNLELFVTELMELAADGWELDTQYPPAQFGILYEAHVLKDTDKITPPPLTRAEITAKARAAKAAKARGEAPQEDAESVGEVTTEIQTEAPAEAAGDDNA